MLMWWKQELIFNCRSRWLEFIVVRKTRQQQGRAKEGSCLTINVRHTRKPRERSGIEEAPLILQIFPQWCSWSSKTPLSKGFLTSQTEPPTGTKCSSTQAYAVDNAEPEAKHNPSASWEYFLVRDAIETPRTIQVISTYFGQYFLFKSKQ